MREKVTTVPGEKHYFVQEFLKYHIYATCPDNLRVVVDCEYPIRIGDQTYRIDVHAKYFHVSYGHSRVVLYEVQKDLDLPSFQKKMEKLGALGEIIPLEQCPDDIREASAWVREYVQIPSFRRGRGD